MTFCMIRAIVIALFSSSLTLMSYGELIMIRHPSKIENGKRVQNLTCRSEANGNALVWNGELDDDRNDADFPEYDVRTGISLRGTKDNGWATISSVNFPTSPVSHFTWEGFENHENSPENLTQLEHNGTIVFSARGSEDLRLRFGEEAMKNHSCFKITFAASEHNSSGISACNGSITAPLDRILISPFEWRTYIIKWDGNDKIEVKEPGKDRSHVAKNIMEKKVGEWDNINSLVVDNRNRQWIRFHIYHYIQSTTTGSTATTNNITDSTLRNLYFEAVFSLCSKCQLDIGVINNNDTFWSRESIYGDEMLSDHVLPVWRTKKLNISLQGLSNEFPLRIRMITKVKKTGVNVRWAVERFFIYKPEDIIRQSTKTFNISSNADITCQELSGADGWKTSVVHSNRNITNIDSTSLEKCSKGEGGKFCNFNCGSSCKGTSICNTNGCTCALGFTGKNCDKECSDEKYGYNCRKSCIEVCGNRKCNKMTGKCSQSECRGYFLPPNCTKELTKPQVECIDETGVKLNYTRKDLDDDEWEHLRFETIEINSPNSVNPKQEWTIVDLIRDNAFSPWRWSEKTVENLKPMTMYSVRAVLNKTRGPTANFDTKCWKISKPQNVSLIARENGNMTLKWKHDPRFWEHTKNFDVHVEVLDSTMKKNPVMHNLSTTTTWFRGQNVSQVQLQLHLYRNYTFSITEMNSDANQSRVVNLWYLIPDNFTVESSQDKLPNSAMKRISFKFSDFANITVESIDGVIMNRSYTCPILKQNQNSMKLIEMSEANFSRPEGFEEGEYPACELNLKETYLFTVTTLVDVGTAFLMWLCILPIFVSCLLMFYFLYWKPKHVSLANSKIFLIGDVSDIQLHSVKEPDKLLSSSCVPPEIQKLKNFENSIRKAAESGLLQQQFMSLPRGLVRPCDYGRLPDNKPKNRYGNLIAYDDTRVMLIADSRGAHSDYINANYVQGYCKEKAYIATQGPLPETVVDFWRMIWQEEVRIICMLVDLVESGKNMCEQYWPEVGEEIQYGDIVILTTNEHIFADFTYRTFLVTKFPGTESHTVVHLQYTSWPEEGVPMHSHSVVEFLQKMLSVPPGQGPIVVHCNSGTGRTGVIILADICWRYLATEGTVDIFVEAQKMFNARANMLRNFPQYVMSHLVPIQCLIMLPTKILCSDVTPEKIEEMKNDLPIHVTRLADCAWMDKALRILEPLRPPVPENISKNRFPKLTPVGPSLVTLTRYPTYDDNSDYISAVSVDGLTIRQQYIASQLPMPSTLTDFWRLIIEKNIELVIILQQSDSDDDTCCDIIPRGTTVIPVPYLKVETKTSSNRNEHFTTDKMLLTDTSQNLTRSKIITALTCDNWNSEEVARPPAPKTLIELWRASERIKRDGPTLVLCYDGITGCGLYLTLSLVLERMSVEQECDVISAVRALRRSRSDFMCFPWQFGYLYDVVLEYAKSFENYGNFTRGAGSNCRYE